jgi:hypothetical protein
MSAGSSPLAPRDLPGSDAAYQHHMELCFRGGGGGGGSGGHDQGGGGGGVSGFRSDDTSSGGAGGHDSEAHGAEGGLGFCAVSLDAVVVYSASEEEHVVHCKRAAAMLEAGPHAASPTHITC